MNGTPPILWDLLLFFGGGPVTTVVRRKNGKDMNTRSLTFLAVVILASLGSGCGRAWQMDYGEPAAQFCAQDIASKGQPFIGKKITVKGKVLRVENREDGNHIYLEHDIHGVFPAWQWGEDDLKAGDEIYVDGFLEKCTEGDVLLTPALKRDPTSSFKPFE